MTVHVTVPVDEAAKAELEGLALARGLGLDDVMAEAVAGYLEEQRAMLAAIDEGLADIEAGRVVPHEEVVAEMKRWRAAQGAAD